MRPRYAVARRKARELLIAGEVDAVPVPLERLADSLNATIRYEPFEGNLSGMVHRTGSGAAIIGINSLHSATRQRFTIAHELGHLVLHADTARFHVDQESLIGLRDETSALATDVREIEANQFASELLMPEVLLRAEIEKLPATIDPENYSSELARRFRVSPQAMAIRLSRLEILHSG